MNISNAKYRVKRTPDNSIEIWKGISVTIDGIDCTVPLDDKNAHYIEIMKLVDSGDLVIEPADEPLPPDTPETSE